jgi:manganese/zinc/iron transport system substrate-binding protein
MQLKTALVGIIGLALLTACSQPPPAPVDIASRKIRVTTTVGMITDIVRNVGGDRLIVTGLMGPGVDPHLYKPSARDVTRLGDADIIFYGGLDLEGRMTELFEKIEKSGKKTVAVSEDIDRAQLRDFPGHPGRYDPHIWFDVTLWQSAVRAVEKELSAFDPLSQPLYERNAKAYLAQLDELQAYVVAQVALVDPNSRLLITAHDAFGYFGDRYGFEVLGLQGSSTASEAAASDVRSLAELITQRKIKAIFIESSVPQATIEAVQAAVRSRGWDVQIGGSLFSDAMGGEDTPEGTYIGMVRHNVDTIVGSLK